MRTTEDLAPDGAERLAGDTGDVTDTMNQFLNEFRLFHGEVKSRFQQQEERLAMLDRKSTFAGRPALASAALDEAPHRKALAAYLRSGDDDALRGIVPETKAMTTAVSADGGYLINPEMADRIRGVLRSSVSLRSVATVVNVEGGSFDVVIDRTDLGSGWATEVAALGETTTPALERISIRLHELAALPKASQRLLDDAAFDVEGWLSERIANKFVRAEAAAFLTGDGIDKPRGVLDYPKITNGSWAWGQIGYVPTGAAGDFAATNASDAIVDLVYALGSEYRHNGTFLMNSKTAGAVRKMKDADGRFMWSDGLALGEPSRLMGYPVLVAEDMPDIAANSFAIAFGDFHAGYTVAERPDLRILRDPFSAKPNVLFYASKRVGGDVTDFNAIKLLKFAVS